MADDYNLQNLDFDDRKLKRVVDSFEAAMYAFVNTEDQYLKFLRTSRTTRVPVSLVPDATPAPVREIVPIPTVPEEERHQYPDRDAGAEAAKIIRKRDHETVNFLEPDEHFAKGGFVTKPTNAIIGEAGPELVLPLNKLGGAIDLVIKKGAGTVLDTTLGFLTALPESGAKSKLLQETQDLRKTFGTAGVIPKFKPIGLTGPVTWWNKGRDERVEDEDNASWEELWKDDNAQKGMSDENFESGGTAGWFGRPDQAFNPFRPAEKGGPGSGPTPMVRQLFERPIRGVKRLLSNPSSVFGGAPNTEEGPSSDASDAIPTPDDNGLDILGLPVELNPSAESGWQRAIRAAAADGVDLAGSVTSSFRSAAEQEEMLEDYQRGDPNIMDPAPVGMSPHQQGWALDIDQNSEANQWMRQHGRNYGFNWVGAEDPVHFDFVSDESNTKYLQPDNNDWMPDDPADEGEAKNKGNVVEKVQKAKKLYGAVKGAKAGAAGGPWGAVAGAVVGYLKGDGGNRGSISAPSSSQSTETVTSEPVVQGSGDGPSADQQPVIVPIPLPQPPKAMPQGGDMPELPKGKRVVVIDLFGKGSREVIHAR